MDHKKHKFDRQIRLWGVHGQSALENAHVLVIGSGGVAAETLKNLVLPNLKAFTVVDHTLVSQVDLSSSFFVSHDGIGMPRAQVVCELVKELNPSVQGYAVIANPEELTDDFFVK
jgi:amyloid beta precursor protein binding protein 1